MHKLIFLLVNVLQIGIVYFLFCVLVMVPFLTFLSFQRLILFDNILTLTFYISLALSFVMLMPKMKKLNESYNRRY